MSLQLVDVTRGDALRDASLRVRRGQTLVVHGSPAATRALADVAGGLAPPAQGRVIIEGHDISGLDTRDRTTFRLQHIRHVRPADARLDGFRTVLDVLGGGQAADTALDLRELEALRMLESLRLSPVADRLVAELDPETHTLVAVLAALLDTRRVLVLERPFPALTPAYRRHVLDVIRSEVSVRDLTCLIATSDLHLALDSPERVLLRSGRIVDPLAAA